MTIQRLNMLFFLLGLSALVPLAALPVSLGQIEIGLESFDGYQEGMAFVSTDEAGTSLEILIGYKGFGLDTVSWTFSTEDLSSFRSASADGAWWRSRLLEMSVGQIVTRDAGNVLSFSEYHRWAGPLEADIASVMAQNIATLLESDRVTPFTLENLFFQPTHRVVININRYDSQLAKEFLIDATWSIKDLKSRKLLLLRNSTLREPLASADYEELVAAQSKALAAMSQEIAAALAEVVP